MVSRWAQEGLAGEIMASNWTQEGLCGEIKVSGTWGKSWTKILLVATRCHWLTQYDLSRLLFFKNFNIPESPRLQKSSQYWGIAFEALLKPASNWLHMPFKYRPSIGEPHLKPI